MKINLILTLPIIGPFLLLGLARAVWFTAGAEWSDPTLAAWVCTTMGFFGGILAAAIADVEVGRFTFPDLIKSIKGGV